MYMLVLYKQVLYWIDLLKKNGTKTAHFCKPQPIRPPLPFKIIPEVHGHTCDT